MSTKNNPEAYIEVIVKKAKKAQEIADTYTQEKVDELCAAIAYVTSQPDFARETAIRLFEESGMGDIDDKTNKMFSKVKGVYRDMKNEKSVGLIEEDVEKGISVYAKPMGVIGALVPVTNGEATPVVMALMALKGRNAIILAPHPKGRKTNAFIVEKIQDTLQKCDAPTDLVQAIDPEYVSVETSGLLMKDVDFVLAVGGTPMVKAAYSSGTPTIGVGTGNVVTLVDGTTDMDTVANAIIRSKKFDNATSCSTENNVVVFEACYQDFIEAMERQGAYLVRENTEEKERMQKTMWPNTPNDHELNRHVVGQPPKVIAEMAGIKIPDDTRLILVEENGGFGNDFPFTGEKLSPVTGVRKCTDFEDGVQKMEAMLNYQGLGHSCGIHTTDDARVKALAERMKVTKIVVNLPQSLTNSGSWINGLPFTTAVGCGTWGHTSISQNITWKELINHTRVSRAIPSTQPTDDELFDAEFLRKFK